MAVAYEQHAHKISTHLILCCMRNLRPRLFFLVVFLQYYCNRALSTSDLLYVKEDLIIPGSVSFYDLIVGKARGKSGPLFHFDVHEDVRATHDATIEKDESHAGGSWLCTRQLVVSSPINENDQSCILCKPLGLQGAV